MRVRVLFRRVCVVVGSAPKIVSIGSVRFHAVILLFSNSVISAGMLKTIEKLGTGLRQFDFVRTAATNQVMATQAVQTLVERAVPAVGLSFEGCNGSPLYWALWVASAALPIASRTAK
jgi:hypothetical protein